jgi:NADH:ubiquinone oxidoreductase subunit F (NADH-binding)
MSPDEVVEKSGLRLWWCWFPAGMKWSFIDKNQENTSFSL